MSDIFCVILCEKLEVSFHNKMVNGRKSHTLDFKLRVIERLHELGDNVSATARAMKVSRRVMDRCSNCEADVRHLHGRKKRGNTLRKRRRLCKPGRLQFEDMAF